MLNTQRTLDRFWLIIGLCWFVYATAYFGRVNLSIALPFLHESYGYSNASLGIVASGFFFAYAAGQLINGFLGDIFNLRFFVSIGLFCAGICNVLFGLSQQIAFLFLFWTINGYVQSMLWGPLIRVVSDSSPSKYLSRTTLFFASSTIFGYLFAYTLVGRIAIVLGWKMVFFIPGIILMLSALLWFSLYKPLPSAAQEPAAPRSRGGQSEYAGVFYFFVKTKLWVVALVCMLGGSLKEGITLWGPTFFSSFQKLPMEKALFLMSLVPLMNCIGLVASGVVCRYFRDEEKPATILFVAASLVLAVILRISMSFNYTLMDIAFFGLLAIVFGANNILTAFVPQNFRKERRISTAAGALDCAVYIGAAVSGPLAGFLADSSGWFGIMNGWVGICALAVVFALLSRNYKRHH